VVFAATSKNEKFTDDNWICESGAFGHYCNSSKSMLNFEQIKESIMIGNGKSMMATKVGILKCQIIQLDEVKFVPELWVNLFSINKVLKNGYLLSSVSVTFDRVMRTRND
jgi:hypothetical protein